MLYELGGMRMTMTTNTAIGMKKRLEHPRFGAGGYYSETDVGMVGDHEDQLQHALLGHSNYGSPRYGSNYSPRGLR